jgi:L-lactate dehydrogenase complex protein LldG
MTTRGGVTPAPPAWGTDRMTAALDDLLEGFRLRAEPLGARVERAASPAAAVPFLAELAASWNATEAVVAEGVAAASGLADALGAAGLALRAAGTPDETRDAPLGVSFGELALAETGSVLLAESSLADRAIGMLAAGHLMVVPTGALVPGLDEAAPALRAAALRPGGGYATLVTGPSRTADIERVLTVGVQGPARVAILFLDSPG